MAKKRKTTKKKTTRKMRIVFVTKEQGLARQVARTIKTLTAKTKHRPGRKPGPHAGGWSQSGGWLLDNGPSGPWGLMGGWTQGSDRRRPNRHGKLVKPARRKSVRRALKKATARRR